MTKYKYLKLNKYKKIRYLSINNKANLCVVFLHGFMSDLEGNKPKSLLKFCKNKKIGFLGSCGYDPASVKTCQFLLLHLLFISPEITALQSPPPPLLASSAQLCTRGIGELFLTDFLCAFCTGKLTFAMCTIPTTTCQSIHITSSSIIYGNHNQMKSFGKKDSWLFLKGQTISEWIFEVMVSQKIQTKIVKISTLQSRNPDNSYIWRNDDFINSSWNCLTFRFNWQRHFALYWTAD